MSERRWMWPAIWTVVIAGELVMAWDWWSNTPQGQAFAEKMRAKVAERAEKLKTCAGCNRRKAALRSAINRVHWDAERIVEGEDVPTVPDP